jgi:hypothetical protein
VRPLYARKPNVAVIVRLDPTVLETYPANGGRALAIIELFGGWRLEIGEGFPDLRDQIFIRGRGWAEGCQRPVV